MNKSQRLKYVVMIVAICCAAAGCITPNIVPLNEELKSSEDEQMLWHRVQKELYHYLDG